MASGFWYLEDGRCFSRRWSWMVNLLDLINQEIKSIKGAESFSEYLDLFIMDGDDEYNGYGGFIRKSTGEDIMIHLDLREFTENNRDHFWQGTQLALSKLIKNRNEVGIGNIHLLTVLLDMHKRIVRSEDPKLLNDLITIEPYSGEKKVLDGNNQKNLQVYYSAGFIFQIFLLNLCILYVKPKVHYITIFNDIFFSFNA